jgi:hypothetical protein
MRQTAFFCSIICVLLSSCTHEQSAKALHERVYSDVYESKYLDSLFIINNTRIQTIDYGLIQDSLRSTDFVKKATIKSRLLVGADIDLNGSIASCDIVNDSILAFSSKASGVVLYDWGKSKVVLKYGVGRGPSEFVTATDIQSLDNKFAVIDPAIARLSLFENLIFSRALPFKSISVVPSFGIKSDGVSIIDDLQDGNPSILFMPFDENKYIESIPLQKWFSNESMSLYNKFILRQSNTYTIIASPGAPYVLVLDINMNITRIIQLKFFPSHIIDLSPRGVSSSSSNIGLAHQIKEIQIKGNMLYVLTKFVDYVVMINLDGNEDDWHFLKLIRSDEGLSLSEFKSIYGKNPPMTSYFDIKDDMIVTCSPFNTEIDLLQLE